MTKYPTDQRPPHPNQIIAAIRDDNDLNAVLCSPIKTVFLLSGDIRTLCAQCEKLHSAGKHVFLHVDLVNGLKGDASGIQFAADNFHLNGIISTKAQCLKFAKDAQLLAILRIFVLDSSAFKTGLQHAQNCKPDFIEVLPGVSQRIIRMATQHFNVPVIAGGLVQNHNDVTLAIEAGASAVSTSRHELWL